jgi:hypothetical protein
MIEVQLVPLGVKTANGTGEAYEISNAQNRVFLISLSILRTLEQQALEIVLEWSADGAAWGRMAVMPQRFYEGSSEMALDLRKLSEVKWVRARWELERWGRWGPQLSCDFGVRLSEIPAQS